MFFFPGEDRPVISPHDLRMASECEFALVRGLDVLLGRAPRVEEEGSAMMDRIIELGNAHENAERVRLGRLHPGRVRDLRRGQHTREGYEAAMRETLAALDSDVDVLCQATFFDGRVLGYADFLERTEQGWLVSDTKLARSANVAALLQIGAYAAQLQDHGVPTAPVARLVLGNDDRRDYPLSEIVPVYRSRLARLHRIVDEHLAGDAAAGWVDDGRWLACGRCDVCEAEIVAHRDLTLVSGMRAPTRRRLMDAGITTIDALATSSGHVDGIQDSRLDQLRAQARLQLTQLDDADAPVAHEVFDESAICRLPAPSSGDLFFDFEGDPLWAERGSKDWGLEYLFGVVEVDSGEDRFRAFWAHDREQEKQALVDFVRYVQERRRRWPDLHIYHYAPYETAALKRLASRHAVCEDDIDQFLRDEVFVDLYATVRCAIRVSQRSYSIKKLEPLYMGARTADLQKGDDSIVEYHRFMTARLEGRFDAAQDILDGIAEYNKDDCVSTRLLRDWLVGQVPVERLGQPSEVPEPRPPSPERAAAVALEADLRALVEHVAVADRRPEDHAVALVAASVLFHAREDKPFWWEHYERIKHPVQSWRHSSGAAVVDGEPELLEPWHKPTARSGLKRSYAVRVDPAGGTLLDIGKVTALYAAPPGFPPVPDHQPGNAHARSPSQVEVVEAQEELTESGRVFQRLTILENAPAKTAVDDFPVAFVPSGTVGTKNLDEALHELAHEVLHGHPSLPRRAGIDLLLRRAPRLRSGGALPAPGEGPDRFIDAITQSLTGMDDSFVAVQGPPGTGKTYVGAQVIARLVDLGWKVGVCSQGHAAVENVLDAVVRAGVSPDQVGKCAKHTEDPPWTAFADPNDMGGFLAGHAAAGRGVVVGGTAWDLTNPARVGRGELDLVVVDEAGQFSLGKTLAVSMAGARLLLLGDPAQLPQVSQGTHAEPIDHSALGWLAGDDDLLPAELGYFLETTWRMHPRLTEAVSALSYAGQLTSQEEVTSARTLEGVEPGLHEVLVDHHDNKTFSPEEAEAVLDLVTDLVGRTWTAPDDPEAAGGRPLEQRDIVVITPYNNQVGTLKARLRRAGFDDVAVGTVDKFQGQEAPVAILSMAASAHADVSRGMGFLLSRNRLNVAISRGKHAAYVVRSRVLTDFAPRTPDELLALGAFLTLGERARRS